MNILAFRHFEFDDTSAIDKWAKWGGHQLTVVNPADGLVEEWLIGWSRFSSLVVQ